MNSIGLDSSPTSLFSGVIIVALRYPSRARRNYPNQHWLWSIAEELTGIRSRDPRPRFPAHVAPRRLLREDDDGARAADDCGPEDGGVLLRGPAHVADRPCPEARIRHGGCSEVRVRRWLCGGLTRKRGTSQSNWTWICDPGLRIGKAHRLPRGQQTRGAGSRAVGVQRWRTAKVKTGRRRRWRAGLSLEKLFIRKGAGVWWPVHGRVRKFVRIVVPNTSNQDLTPAAESHPRRLQDARFILPCLSRMIDDF
jgi:hypothetical protein